MKAAQGPAGLHLIKLCVGAEDVADLAIWIADVLETKRRKRQPQEHIHVTRQTPKRAGELLAGGSLYWVIKGQIRARQRILELRPVTSAEGTPACGIVLAPQVVPTALRAQRPFQGWRYLDGKAAPADLARGAGALPQALQAELAELGLL